MVDFSLFSDAVIVVKEISTGLVSLTSLPKERREHYRDIVDETFTLLDHAILLVIQRLSDCVRLRSERGDAVFMDELSSLHFVGEWERIERDVRLCRALRASSDEMRHLFSNIGSKLSLSDSNKFWSLVSCVLEGETLLATQIADTLSGLSQIQNVDDAMTELNKCIKDLKHQRRLLIEAQVVLMKAI